MRTIQSEFYGDKFRWFIGIVEETASDEPKLGRVKVRIYGVHGDRQQVPTADLPYAQVMVPTTEPGISGLGRNPMLAEGATVFGIFMDGVNSQLPLVLGSIPTVQVPSIEQINSESYDESFNDPIKVNSGSSLGGTPGYGTNGTASIRSAYAGGLDGFEVDPNAPVGTNTQIAWEYFNRTGKYSHAVIAGIIGNLLAESGSGKPLDINPGAKGDVGLKSASDVSIGIAQWYNGTSRQQQLYDFAAKAGKSVFDLYVQLAFIDHELSTEPYFRGNELKQKKTPTEAAIHFQRNYEKPAFESPVAYSPVDGQKMRLHEHTRIKYAKMVYNQFTRKPTTGVS